MELTSTRVLDKAYVKNKNVYPRGFKAELCFDLTKSLDDSYKLIKCY